MNYRVPQGTIWLLAAAFCCTDSVALAAQRPSELPQELPVIEPSYGGSRLDLDSARWAQVQAALEKKDYRTAESILVEAAEQSPGSPKAANLLEFAGGIFFLHRQFLNAAISWKKADAIAPLNQRSRFTLAMAYIELGRPQWARLELERLVAVQAENPLYWYWLARLDYDAHRYSEAIAELQHAISLDPKMVRAHDLLGLCYDYLGRLNNAVSSFERAVVLNRSQPTPSPWPDIDMAISQIELGQLAKAESNLREAVRYDSKLPQARYQLGRVLDKEGNTAGAIEEFKSAIALDPRYPEPHYLLGRIYHRLAKDELAGSEIQKFRQLQAEKQQP
jgi:tetratricopeptide (TPR) repeat protein